MMCELKTDRIFTTHCLMLCSPAHLLWLDTTINETITDDVIDILDTNSQCTYSLKKCFLGGLITFHRGVLDWWMDRKMGNFSLFHEEKLPISLRKEKWPICLWHFRIHQLKSYFGYIPNLSLFLTRKILKSKKRVI